MTGRAGGFSLRVLTFNVWMLPAPLPGTDRSKRLPRIVAALREVDADIVAVQEAFDPTARRTIVEGLTDRYEMSDGALETRRALGLVSLDRTGGLLVFSKFPITRSSFARHALPRRCKPFERIGAKGVLRTTIETSAGAVRLWNVHCYAGGSERSRAVRRMQLRHLVKQLDAVPRDVPILIAGDFNAWHDNGRRLESGSQPEYRLLRDAGLRKTTDGDPNPRVTYDVDGNRYAAWWSDRSQGAQEFDAVFVRDAAERAVRFGESHVVFAREQPPLSDHYGYLTQVAISPLRSEPPA